MSAQNIAVLTLTRVASGVIAANRFVTVAGAQCGAGVQALGVTHVAAVATSVIPVIQQGTAIVEAGAAVAANAVVQSDADGKAITKAAGLAVGIALDAAGAAGEMIEVLLIPVAP